MGSEKDNCVQCELKGDAVRTHAQRPICQWTSSFQVQIIDIMVTLATRNSRPARNADGWPLRCLWPDFGAGSVQWRSIMDWTVRTSRRNEPKIVDAHEHAETDRSTGCARFMAPSQIRRRLLCGLSRLVRPGSSRRLRRALTSLIESGMPPTCYDKHATRLRWVSPIFCLESAAAYPSRHILV